MLLKLVIIFISIFVFLNLRNFFKLKRKKNFLKTKKLTTFNKKNLNNWMSLTKKERYNLSKQESISYLDKRKNLLEEIRKEYKRISRGNSKENIE
tara:strand:- start:380 stop:664 length:285 start_codon:yes stop_codon:yes gene_type:complete